MYENNYKTWLDFLSQARPIERTIRLSITDLITLDPTKKIMIEHVKAFWTKISLHFGERRHRKGKSEFSEDQALNN